MQYIRTIKSQIQKSLSSSDDFIILYGARQVGKTSLCQEILKEYNESEAGKSRYF
jgi:predicted AAA+ superfamily ATPase